MNNDPIDSRRVRREARGQGSSAAAAAPAYAAVLACAAGLACAPAARPPAAGAPSPAGGREAGVRVHVEAPPERVVRLLRLGPRAPQRLCAAPCNAEIREAGDRFAVLDHHYQSRSFRLAGHGGDVSLRVAPASPTLMFGGFWVVALGGGISALSVATLFVGVDIENQGRPAMARDLWATSGLLLGAGALISLGGWMMRVAGVPSVAIRSGGVSLDPSALAAHW